MVLQRVDSVYDLEWSAGVKYRDVRFREEVEQSKYAFGQVDIPQAEFSALHRDLLARIACANASAADALVAIHFNAFDDSSATGAETFFDPARPFAGRSRALAESLQAALVAELRLDDRGVTSDEDLSAPTITDAGAAYGHLIELGPRDAGWVDTPSAMPGALVEPLFLTAPDEAVLAARADGQARIARALADGLGGYFSRS